MKHLLPSSSLGTPPSLVSTLPTPQVKIPKIRLWGRRRIHLLERLIPLADHFDLYVKGAGLPYFVVAQMGPMQFTLGLSSWTTNNFSSAARFDLLTPRGALSNTLKSQIYDTLKAEHSISIEALAHS